MCAGYWRNRASGFTTAMLRAKRLMRTDARLQAGLKKLVGEQVYSAEGVLQKPVLAQFRWLARLTSRLSTMWFIRLWRAISSRAAMSGWRVPSSSIAVSTAVSTLDFVVCVTAPVPVRIQRIMQRDHIPAEKAQQWIDAVMPQEELAARSLISKS